MAEALSPALPNSIEALAEAVLEEAERQSLKLVTAESCTGGLLASLLTDVPGKSHVFERGFVTYAAEAKSEMLAVPREILECPGPVSEPVARAMASGALARSRGDIALAITGFADSAPDTDDTGGLVHFAVARRGGLVRHRREHFGDLGRAEVRVRSLRAALDLLLEAMKA